jgi:membrane-bound metal-dependent hydrolase YbcI (DUF457 family)
VATIVYAIGRTSLKHLIRPMTVHRGILHTVLAAIVLSEMVYLVVSGSSELRTYKAGAVLIGYMTHLLMDELASVEWSPFPNLKQSAGSAFKFFGKDRLVNIMGVIAAIGLAVVAALAI